MNRGWEISRKQKFNFKFRQIPRIASSDQKSATAGVDEYIHQKRYHHGEKSKQTHEKVESLRKNTFTYSSRMNPGTDPDTSIHHSLISGLPFRLPHVLGQIPSKSRNSIGGVFDLPHREVTRDGTCRAPHIAAVIDVQ
jgi:hypothetical protein